MWEWEGEVWQGNRTGRLGCGLSYGLICWRPGLFAEVRRIGETASHDHVRTALNPAMPSWKAGWVHALTSSNLVSSAITIPALTRAGITVAEVR